MPQISPEFIERYQLEYQKNPNSRVFAPLAEAYRQMGLLDEAIRVANSGVQRHPDFAGGRVALAKILIDRKEFENALPHLEHANKISPDNILANSLLGETLLELRRPKEALKAYKMVLFLNPNDEKAQRAVKKWEFLSADEYDEELFEMKPVFGGNIVRPPMIEPEADEPVATKPLPTLAEREYESSVERAVSLADAFTVRGDFDRAREALESARDRLGPAPEIEKRLNMLTKRAGGSTSERPPSPAPHAHAADSKDRIEHLRLLLQRIAIRRADD